MVAKTALILTLLSTAAWAQGSETIGVRERVWRAGLTGDIRADSTVAPGTTVDVQDDFDFPSGETFHDVTVWVNVPLLPLRFNAGAWLGGFDETLSLQKTINFGNQTFTAGTTIDAKVDFRCFYLNAEYFLPTIGMNAVGISVGFELGLKYFSAEAEVTGGGVTEKKDVKGPIPVVGIDIIANITNWVRAEIEVNGLASFFGPVRGHFIDGSFEVVAAPIKYAFIGLGWKLVDISVKTQGDPSFECDLMLSGPFLTIGIRF